jgi:hypothetical protein
MPVIIEGGETALLYPEDIAHTEPKYKAGQEVPNWFGNLYTIAGLRRDIKCVEAWVPDAENEDGGSNKLVIDQQEWEYLLVRPKGRNDIYEWGWCKESEITKYIEESK